MSSPHVDSEVGPLRRVVPVVLAGALLTLGQDLGAAVDFLAAQPAMEAGRIGALGFSMGGEEAIGAQGADDRTAAVVAEGATVRVAGDVTAAGA